jgi:hypothetical protein
MGVNLDFARGKMPLVMTASLSLVSKSHTLRCDAKQAETRFAVFDKFISSVEHFYLGDHLPKPFIKGAQPKYLETLEPGGVPVINTLSIQQLSIRIEQCRFIAQEDFDVIEDERKPKPNDVLLTVDGGTSIGKPVLFDLEGDYAIDSHVAILRPAELDPRLLVYLLASPLGQVQFQQAESGASGQTGVTEEDIRRFRFPLINEDDAKQVLSEIERKRAELAQLAATLREKEEEVWNGFNQAITSKAKHR